MADEPRLDRPVILAFRGDWGQANMHRICGWLAQEIGDRSPRGSEFSIWSGRGGSDQIAALRSGTADIAVVTPAAAVHLLEPGDLCALGVIGSGTASSSRPTPRSRLAPSRTLPRWPAA